MAIINLENIAATASITIQLIKDYSMYESEIISSNGTIFQSTDTDTTLTLRIFKGVEDVTNKITDIEWSRYYFENEELKEDFAWKEGKQNEKRIVLYKEEIEGKSIIQASCYSMIEGNRELVSTARLTVIKISDVYVSDVTPIDPSDKMMWMDTKISPPVLKIWNDELGIWISSGTEIPIVKNFIRNSNFWTDIGDYYSVENSSYINEPVITVYQNKNWATLSSKNQNTNGGGLAQEIQDPVITNSSYILSFIAFRENSSTYTGTNIAIKIYSTNKNGVKTTLIDTTEQINTTITSVSVPFTTLQDTDKISIYIGTQNRRRCYFHITELSLYNSAVYYPWEACPDDVNNQMNVKLDNNRLAVFNTLTDNNNYKAIYESNKQYYIRREYITPEVATQDEVTGLSNDFSTFKKNDTEDKISINKDISALQSNLSSLTKVHSSDKSAIDSSISSLQSELSSLKKLHSSDKKELDKSIQSLIDKDNAFNKSITSLQSTHEADILALDGRIGAANTSITDVQNSVSAILISIGSINEVINSLNGTISSLQSSISSLESRIKTLEDKNNASGSTPEQPQNPS